jgi:hypothetical protein
MSNLSPFVKLALALLFILGIQGASFAQTEATISYSGIRGLYGVNNVDKMASQFGPGLLPEPITSGGGFEIFAGSVHKRRVKEATLIAQFNGKAVNSSYRLRSNSLMIGWGMGYHLLDPAKYKFRIYPLLQVVYAAAVTSIARTSQGSAAGLQGDPLQSSQISHQTFSGIGSINFAYQVAEKLSISASARAFAGIPTPWYSDNWSSIRGLDTYSPQGYQYSLGLIFGK